jgi:adenylate cyclase
VFSYVQKSGYLNRSRRPDEAVRVADAGLAVNPNIPYLYMARAGAELSLGRFDEAKSDIQQAIRLSPRDSFTTFFHVALGDAEIGAGRPEAAIVEYRKALVIPKREEGFRKAGFAEE